MNSHFPMKKGLMAITILCIVSFVLLSGCTSGLGGGSPTTSSGEKSYSGSSTGYSPPLAAPNYGGTQDTSNSYTGYTPVATASGYDNVNDRKVIMTGSVSLETSDLARVTNSVRSIAQGAGGYVSSSSTWQITTNQNQSSITVRVPAAQYEACLAQIKALGTVKSESSSGQDVTMTYIDTSARLQNLRAEETQLQGIMGMSKNVTEVLAVEQQLYRVRGEIESTQQQLNYLNSSVGFSTITVTVTEPQPTVAYDWGIDTAFKDGVRAFIGMIGALIVLTGYLIPLILYLAVGLVVLFFAGRFIWRLYNNWKNKKVSKP